MMKLKLMGAVIGIAAIGLAISSANAAPITFFGENQTPGAVVSGDPLTARNAYLSNLSGGVGTETFEGIALGTTPPGVINFPGSTGAISATWVGNGDVADTTTDISAGRFATSGSQWVRTSGTFTLNFSDPIAAFGFYGTDIGDVNGSVTVDLTRASDNAVINLVVPHVVNGASGSLLFFGFIDAVDTYSSITFGNTAPGSDFFGFDDMTIGDAEQVTLVPEPGMITIFGLGLLGLGFARRRKHIA